MSYLTAIAKARHEILKDDEEPRDILISVALKHALLAEVNPYMTYRFSLDAEKLMGMNVEWTKPVPLTQPQIVIRTAKGDTRIVRMLDGDKNEPR